MIKNILKKLTTSTDDPFVMRNKQYFLMGGIMVIGLGLLHFITNRPLETLHEPPKEDKKEAARLETPFEAVNPQDIWVNRIQKEAEEAKAEAKAVRQENQMMGKKLETIEKFLMSGGLLQKERQKVSVDPSGESLSSPAMTLSPPGFAEDIPPVSGKNLQGQKFSPASLPSGGEDGGKGDDRLFDDKPPSKIFHMGLPGNSGSLLKNIDNYVPAGSYARAVLTSGVVASTALKTAEHPQPIMLRLVDDGHLPRGFLGTMNENVLIGACYGDLSSERVMCRLETMSWVEKDGITVEKKVEGWIVGEDGRPGLRGEVVDRSGEAVRDTMIAGMLSGLSGFLKTEATSNVYPMTPFGQTNALKGKHALGGAASTGAGNALDKLAEFSIKRAEQMQPVILIASGRVVDVVFKAGVDIRPELAAPSLTLIDQKQNASKEQHHETDY